jgi:hypothetical protein
VKERGGTGLSFFLCQGAEPCNNLIDYCVIVNELRHKLGFLYIELFISDDNVRCIVQGIHQRMVRFPY